LWRKVEVTGKIKVVGLVEVAELVEVRFKHSGFSKFAQIPRIGRENTKRNLNWEIQQLKVMETEENSGENSKCLCRMKNERKKSGELMKRRGIENWSSCFRNEFGNFKLNLQVIRQVSIFELHASSTNASGQVSPRIKSPLTTFCKSLQVFL
jgi:hypothetical protein